MSQGEAYTPREDRTVGAGLEDTLQLDNIVLDEDRVEDTISARILQVMCCNSWFNVHGCVLYMSTSLTIIIENVI